MCLNTNQTKPLIAKKNIKCYKFLKIEYEELISPYYYFVWKKRNTEKTEMKTFNVYHNILIVENGFHAYLKKNWVKRYIELYNNFHNEKVKIKTFIIPKGSEYYISKHGKEIVSNQIKMI